MPKEINFYNYEHGYAVSLNHKETLYTQSELNQAVEAEREAIITLFNIYMESDNMTANLLIKLIRARSK